MPSRKHEPCSLELMNYVSPHNTICEVLRTIYHEAVKINSPVIQYQARVAVTMAKAMNSKLKEYNKGWYGDFYDINPNEEVMEVLLMKKANNA